MVLERSPNATSVIDVLDHVLDKGIVIDAWIATYLKHSQALARATLVSGGVFETARSPRRSQSKARIR